MKSTTEIDIPDCKNCGSEFEHRIKRPVLVKAVTFWMPLRRYHCSGCLKNYYILTPKGVSGKNSYIMLPSLLS